MTDKTRRSPRTLPRRVYRRLVLKIPQPPMPRHHGWREHDQAEVARIFKEVYADAIWANFEAMRGAIELDTLFVEKMLDPRTGLEKD